MRITQMQFAKQIIYAIFLLIILALSSTPILAADGDVAINEANFPDPIFRAIVAEPRIDWNQDGVLSAEEIAAVVELDVLEMGITSLQGIEFFSVLERLNCSYNKLSKLDVSKCIRLEIVECTNNKLVSLDISNNNALKRLCCYANELTVLDIKNNNLLTYLDCSNNPLSTLNVSNNTKLEALACNANGLTSLDISKNINLDILGCAWNKLTTLNISHNINLRDLGCYGNQLTDLDVSNNINLQSIIYWGNPLVVAGWLPYTDVHKSDWFYNDVLYSSNNNLIFCENAITFNPNQSASRGILVDALYSHAESPNDEALMNPFIDIDVLEYAFYNSAVLWANHNGIVSGLGDGRFAPEASITRQDLAVIFLRYMNFTNNIKPMSEEYIRFADEEQIADYAKDAVQVLYKLGIMQGVGDNKIDPTGTATRAQLAAMLHRLLQ